MSTLKSSPPKSVQPLTHACGPHLPVPVQADVQFPDSVHSLTCACGLQVTYQFQSKSMSSPPSLSNSCSRPTRERYRCIFSSSVTMETFVSLLHTCISHEVNAKIRLLNVHAKTCHTWKECVSCQHIMQH